MEVVHGKTLAYDDVQLKHRGSGLAFKDLFLGDESDIPNNYYFFLARQQSFYSPVHKHNFDQFRFVTRAGGAISILPDLDVCPGELCYHPEGVEYGPQNDGEGVKEVLVLQFGGASGQGFISHAQLKKYQERMGTKGTFRNGKFYPLGQDEPVDGFQATWEEAMGRPLVYPKCRYDRPIKMTPDNYDWFPMGGGCGVSRKTLGVFSERETRAEVILIQNGRWRVPGEDATQLFFVLNGSGLVEGAQLECESAGRLKPGIGAEITTAGQVELLRIVIPTMHKISSTDTN